MTRTLTTADGLVEAGLLSAEERAMAEVVSTRYAIGVTPEMVALIQRADDPIGLQFLPQAAELVTLAEEDADPIGDHAHSPVEGVVHRYPDRVLLKVLHVCPVYCRFCFRREMVGPKGDGTLAGDRLAEALTYIASRPEIWEVILTGGDPLMLSPRRLDEVMQGLAAIPHVRIVRLHTRVPAVSPDRISEELVAALTGTDKTVYMALHVNHPDELTDAACKAIRRLANGGVTLLSQTVLLRGVNDEPDILAALMRRFVENRVKPYYLHHPDYAPGTGHFRLSIEEGRALVHALRGRVSGLCQPTYVLDIPGGYGKTPLAAETVTADGEGGWMVTDYQGRTHRYPPKDQS